MPEYALSRRALLGLVTAGGAGAALGAVGALPAGAAPLPAGALRGASVASFPGGSAEAADPIATSLVPFPQQDDLNFETLFAYGETAYGVAEVGEISTAVAAVQAAIAAGDANVLPAYQPYCDVFEALGARLAASADSDLAAGRIPSARSRYLRAATYFNCVLFFVMGTSAPGRESAVYAEMQRCWAAAAALLDPVFQRVDIPARVRFPDGAGGTSVRSVTLPAYWARASGTGAKPTVIVNNGSDAQFIDTYAYGGAAGLDRGYNVLLFEGPGQGALLMEQNIPFTPYWQDVVTPVVDFVIAQPETDAARVALTGWSFGGILVMRAAAHEPRLAAVVADPGFWDNAAPWQGLVDAVELVAKPVTNEAWATFYNDYLEPRGAGFTQASVNFLVNKRGGILDAAFHEIGVKGGHNDDLVGLLEIIGSYSGSAELFGAITAHVMLNTYEGDVFVGDQTPQATAWLTSAASVEAHHFVAADGTEFHDAPMAPQVRNEVVFEWLDRVMAVAPTPVPTPTPAPVVPPVTPADPGGGGAALAATGVPAAPVAAIATGLATAGAGVAALAARASSRKA